MIRRAAGSALRRSRPGSPTAVSSAPLSPTSPIGLSLRRRSASTSTAVAAVVLVAAAAAASSAPYLRRSGLSLLSRGPLSSSSRSRFFSSSMAAKAKQERPGGEWESPVTSDLITAGSKALSDPSFGASGVLYWLESRPAERGRTVVVARAPGGGGGGAPSSASVDVTPPLPEDREAPFFNVRTRVHEYGGGALCVIPGDDAKGGGGGGGTEDVVLFSNFADQRLYLQRVSLSSGGSVVSASAPRALTPEASSAAALLRFADAEPDPLAPHCRVFVVLEDHSEVSAGGRKEPENCLAAVSLESGRITKVVRGSDFYSSPRPSPDGKRIAWVEWEHPNMPWDDTTLVVADLVRSRSGQEGEEEISIDVSSRRVVAGGKGKGVSAMEPVWFADPGGSTEFKLAFVSDESGWWNVYADGEGGAPARNLCPDAAEFAGPAWGMGSRPLRAIPSSSGEEEGGAGKKKTLLVARRSAPEESAAQIVVLDPSSSGASKPLVLDTGAFTGFGRIAVMAGGGGARGAGASLAVVAARPTAPAALVETRLDLSSSPPASSSSSNLSWSVVALSSDLAGIEGFVSTPRVVKFPTGEAKKESAYLNFYPPTSASFSLPAGALPPLLVKIHGGPTGQAPAAFSLGVAFWTSRGFAVADVNYRGSSGYGRAFRKALAGQWGIADVEDVANAAKYLAEQGLVDAGKLTVTGGSAGGYTTLAALAFTDVFSAGASHYGVADCALLAAETHKFESRYLDGLIAPCPDPADPPQVYLDRSPIHHLGSIAAPLILFQGLEDRVVPPAQASLMFESLRARGLPVALVEFAGEQHGFRSRDAVRAALEGELFFYGRALGFEPVLPADVPMPEIVNLVKGGVAGPDVEVE